MPVVEKIVVEKGRQRVVDISPRKLRVKKE